MKRFVFASMFVLAFMGFAAATVSAAGPAKPVIEGEMPDCHMSIGGDGITLFTNVSVPDGGTLKYQDAPKPVYDDLLKLVQDKDYFVITTNVDHCFQKAGFDKKRLFYTQGDYGLFQCSEPCCQETFDNEAVIREMVKRQENMKIPTELLPTCPHCGKPLTMNLRSDNKFVEDEGWHRAAERYENFLRTRADGKILFLELGVGYNTPVIIKYPFWQMTAKNSHATYACINQGQAVCPQEIDRQAICVDADIGTTLSIIVGE